MRIIWEGGATTSFELALNKTGGHFRATSEDTVELVRRLAERYDDTTIAPILGQASADEPGPGCRSPAAGSAVCATPTASRLPSRRRRLSHPATMMRSWSPSTRPSRSSGSTTRRMYRWLNDRVHHRRATHPRRALAPPDHRRTPRPDRARRPRRLARPSTRPPEHSESPARPCCTRSSAVNSPPSTSPPRKRKGLRIQVKPDTAGLFATPE